jgi:hypothetical protein
MSLRGVKRHGKLVASAKRFAFDEIAALRS